MMASCTINSTKIVMLLFIATLSFQYLLVSSFEFQVAGSDGWVVPPANGSSIYNDWASENRFRVGDSIRFKYNKDSVMEVSKEDYKSCNSSHPYYFSNNGNSVYNLDRSGPYYFISGVSGHCGKGQRMIIKVMAPDDDGNDSSSGYALVVFGVGKLILVQLVVSYVTTAYVL